VDDDTIRFTREGRPFTRDGGETIERSAWDTDLGSDSAPAVPDSWGQTNVGASSDSVSTGAAADD
jgi:hypothetical protein